MVATAEINTKSKVRRQTVSLDPFEDSIHYQTMVTFRHRGVEVGAYLLKKNAKSPFTLVFGFECSGLHSFLSKDKFAEFFDHFEMGLKDLPQRERLTFHLGAYKNDHERQHHLDKLIADSPSDELRFLLMGEKARVRQLCDEGLREPKSLHIFVTYQASPGGGQNQHWLDTALAKLDQWWAQYSGKAKSVKQTQLKRFLCRAWGRGFVYWKQILENKLKLRVFPMNSEQMWKYLWHRLNPLDSQAIDLPQQVIVNSKGGLEEKINSSVHSTSLLLGNREPVYDKQWVNVGGKYLGVLTFWDKPGAWKNKQHQLCYLWEIVAQRLVTDTEIITQIVPANSKKTSWTMARLTKQSTAKAKSRAEKNDVDVASKLKARRGEEAQERLLLGEMPFYVATVILVKRKTLEELEEACSHIESLFHRPAQVVRERQVTWHRWRQTLPIVDENLLGTPFIGHRLSYLSSEVPGLLPLVKTHSRDREGLELLGEDGGTPIFLDMFSQGNDKHRHMAVFGTTRSGKSVLVGGILTQALARRIPIVAIDYPKPDGSSTYTTYTEFMGKRGAYFDVGKQSVNLFDRPNLRSLPHEQQQERFEDYKDFLCSCLQVMVVGESNDILLNQTVRTILYQALNRFFDDGEILRRYEAAETAGLGSRAWEQMPTLKNFLSYFRELVAQKTFGGLQAAKTESNVVPLSMGAQTLLARALEQIDLRLEYWTQSRVGEAISNPSSVATDASLMVLALRQISENEDAAILSLVAYAAALRRAMAFPISLFFLDESPICFKFPAIVNLIASLISNGAKSGIRVIISAQDPNTIFNSKSGQQILQNINTQLIGRVEKKAVPSFTSIMGYPKELVEACTEFNDIKDGDRLYTQWLLDDKGTITKCRYCPAKVQLALVANNSDEQEIRERFKKAYPDKFEFAAKFSDALADSVQTNRSLLSVAKSYLSPLAA